jgi:hypothetical protein
MSSQVTVRYICRQEGVFFTLTFGVKNQPSASGPSWRPLPDLKPEGAMIQNENGKKLHWCAYQVLPSPALLELAAGLAVERYAEKYYKFRLFIVPTLD